jgi:hypothetical protein
MDNSTHRSDVRGGSFRWNRGPITPSIPSDLPSGSGWLGTIDPPGPGQAGPCPACCFETIGTVPAVQHPGIRLWPSDIGRGEKSRGRPFFPHGGGATRAKPIDVHPSKAPRRGDKGPGFASESAPCSVRRTSFASRTSMAWGSIGLSKGGHRGEGSNGRGWGTQGMRKKYPGP